MLRSRPILLERIVEFGIRRTEVELSENVLRQRTRGRRVH